MILRPLIVIKRIPNIDFMGLHKIGFALSIVLTVASIVLFLTVGLNYGIDFSGGILMEVRRSRRISAPCARSHQAGPRRGVAAEFRQPR
jgi:preprotein translocase subunit SecF